MYIPSAFKIEDTAVIEKIIADNGFATLISQHEGEPCVTHLPLMLDATKQYLYGHLSKANPQWKDMEDQIVLAVFHGPHCYISSSWYETNKSVPTWNYQAVHVYGQIEFMSREELMQSMDDLVVKYEASSSAYQLDEVDTDFLDGLAKAVVGFKIKISRIEAKAKLSQNHSIERRELVIQKLEQIDKEDEQHIAELMRRELEK